MVNANFEIHKGKREIHVFDGNGNLAFIFVGKEILDASNRAYNRQRRRM